MPIVSLGYLDDKNKALNGAWTNPITNEVYQVDMDAIQAGTNPTTVSNTPKTASSQEIKDYMQWINVQNMSDYDKANTVLSKMKDYGITASALDNVMGLSNGFYDKFLTEKIGGNTTPINPIPNSNTPSPITTPSVTPKTGTPTSPTTPASSNPTTGTIIGANGTPVIGKTSPDDFMGSAGLSNIANINMDNAFNQHRIDRMQTRMPQYDAVFNPMPSTSTKGGGSGAKGAGSATPQASQVQAPQSSSMKGA